MAEAILKQVTGGKYSVQSAGVEARGGEGEDLNGLLLKDRASSQHVIEVLTEIGLDISNNYIKRLTSEMVKNADKIIAILKPGAVPEFLKESKKVTYWDIADPDKQTLEFHRKIRDEVRKLVKEFVGNSN
jgi:protein-tyrosine-phosphatase